MWDQCKHNKVNHHKICLKINLIPQKRIANNPLSVQSLIQAEVSSIASGSDAKHPVN